MIGSIGSTLSRLNFPPGATPVSPKIYRILALSGGGYRGLFAAEILRLLSLNPNYGPVLREEIDLFSGTSIGGLIAVGLAIGRTPQELRDAIAEHGPKIFDDRLRVRGRPLPLRKPTGVLGGLFGSKYDRRHLEDTIREVLGGAQNAVVGNVEKPFLVVATCVTTRTPYVISNLSSSSEVLRMNLVDALLATSAAPGYFPAVDAELRSLIDGGLVANAPDLVAFAEVIRAGQAPPEAVRMLSIGTAGTNAAGVPRSIGRRGLLRWLSSDLLPLVLDAQERNTIETAATILGERLLRIDTPPSPRQDAVLALDRATGDATRTLLHLANEFVNDLPKSWGGSFFGFP